MKEVLLQFDRKQKVVLYALRTMAHLKIAEDGHFLWLRGISFNQLNEASIRRLPALHTFRLGENHQLFPEKGITPTASLPALEWQPIAEALPVGLPTAAFAGRTREKIPLELIASSEPQAGMALFTTLAVWKAYAETASAIRLHRTRFAVADNNDVLITGTPLLPLSGKEYWSMGTLLLPGGLKWKLPVLSPLIEEELNPLKDGFVLFHPDGSWEKIPFTCFQTSTRSAIRMTNGEQI